LTFHHEYLKEGKRANAGGNRQSNNITYLGKDGEKKKSFVTKKKKKDTLTPPSTRGGTDSKGKAN